MNWTHVAQMGSCEQGDDPLGSIKCWKILV
jgi:hypothetical protein